MGTGGPFPGGKARSGREADQLHHLVLSSIKLYLLSPLSPALVGQLYFLLNCNLTSRVDIND
jgi:hypothetical protein